MSRFKWVCVNDNSHSYDTKTAEDSSYFCPKCKYGEGILVKVRVGEEQQGDHGYHADTAEPPDTGFDIDINTETNSDIETNIGTDTGSKGYHHKPARTRIIEINPFLPVDDLGLCIMLLDCSGSMWEPAFGDQPELKKDLIADSVSAGIFSLSGNPLKEYAYVLIPYTSIKNVVEEYGNVSNLEQAIKEKMEKKKGATDINGALEVAFKFTQQFIDSDISVLGDYKPRIQSVLDDNMNNYPVPNVRVLLFTDGGQFMGEDKTTIFPSPFKNLKYNGKTMDLLMGAYYGTEEDSDYHKLKALVSKCPRHSDIDQFFLFDDPSKKANLEGLFRMASGASGFCPKCLDEATSVTRNFKS
jgi:hypothetical protein